MRWVLLTISLVASGVLFALWSGGGQSSTPMLLVAMGIVLFFALVPLVLSKKASPPPRTIARAAGPHPTESIPKETAPHDR